MAKTVAIASDNINGVAIDKKRMDDIGEILKSNGLKYFFGGIGPNAHNSILTNVDVPKDAFIINIYGGADSGMFISMTGKWYQGIKANRNMLLVFCCGSDKITGLDWLIKAHDDDYTTYAQWDSPDCSYKTINGVRTPGLNTPDKYLINHGFPFIESSDVKIISDRILKELGGVGNVVSEIDVSMQIRKIPIIQFLSMYKGYKKNPNDKIYHLNQTTLTGEYITNNRFKDMLKRELAFRDANQQARPSYIWIVKPSTPVVVTSKVCNVSTTFMMQPNNWTCGVTCIRMIASRHGLNPSYNWVVDNAWANSNNGTGHSGFRNAITKLGFKESNSYYRKDASWDRIRELIKNGNDVAVNLMTGGLGGWSGNWPHWVLLQCVDENYVWIHDPDKGASIRHDIYTMNQCMDNNGNPDFIISKK